MKDFKLMLNDNLCNNTNPLYSPNITNCNMVFDGSLNQVRNHINN